MRDLQVYEDAEQARKNLEARMGAIGEWDESLLEGVKLPESVKTKDDGSPATLDLGELAGGGIVGLALGAAAAALLWAAPAQAQDEPVYRFSPVNQYGINLTAASHVFLLEPMINPALEAQAIGAVVAALRRRHFYPG